MKKLTRILAAIYPLSWLQSKQYGKTALFANTATSPTEGTHEEFVTKLAAAPFNARRISYVDGVLDNSVAANRGPKLVKSATYSSAGDAVTPITAITDLPIGVVDDSPAASGDPVSVKLLGKGRTTLVFAETAIAIGQLCAVGAAGGVRVKGDASSGASYVIGVCIGSPANQAGDVIEMADYGCIPGSNY